MKQVILFMLYMAILFVHTIPSYVDPSEGDKTAPWGEELDQVPGYAAASGKELFTLAESEEEAKRIADLYGITLVNYSFGVAIYHTEENLGDVIARGIENGWPRLEINHAASLSNDGENPNTP